MSARPETTPAWIAELPLSPLMTVQEVGELLRCSRAESYRIARVVGCIHLGRSVRVPAASLRRWLADQETAS